VGGGEKRDEHEANLSREERGFRRSGLSPRFKTIRVQGGMRSGAFSERWSRSLKMERRRSMGKVDIGLPQKPGEKKKRAKLIKRDSEVNQQVAIGQLKTRRGISDPPVVKEIIETEERSRLTRRSRGMTHSRRSEGT